MLNIANILNPSGLSVSDVTAKTESKLQALPKDIMWQMMTQKPKFF